MGTSTEGTDPRTPRNPTLTPSDVRIFIHHARAACGDVLVAAGDIERTCFDADVSKAARRLAHAARRFGLAIDRISAITEAPPAAPAPRPRLRDRVIPALLLLLGYST